MLLMPLLCVNYFKYRTKGDSKVQNKPSLTFLGLLGKYFGDQTLETPLEALFLCQELQNVQTSTEDPNFYLFKNFRNLICIFNIFQSSVQLSTEENYKTIIFLFLSVEETRKFLYKKGTSSSLSGIA